MKTRGYCNVALGLSPYGTTKSILMGLLFTAGTTDFDVFFFPNEKVFYEDVSICVRLCAHSWHDKVKVDAL